MIFTPGTVELIDINVQGQTIHARVNKETLKHILTYKNDLTVLLYPGWRMMDLLNPAWRGEHKLGDGANHADLWCFGFVRDFVINGKYLLSVDEHKVTVDYLDEYSEVQVDCLNDFYPGYVRLAYRTHMA